MKILHLFKTTFHESFGGIERVIESIVKTPVEDFRFQHVVLSTTSLHEKTQTVSSEGVQYVLVPRLADWKSTPIPHLAEFSRLYRRLLRECDVVHYHFPWPVMDVCDLLFNRGPDRTPSVVTYQSDIIKQKFLKTLYRPVMRRFLIRAGSVVCTSENYRATSPELKWLGDRRAIETIPNGLNFDATTHDRPLSHLQKYRQPYFVFVGAPRYYKGLTNLIDAVAGTDLRLFIIGKGPELPQIRHRARSRKCNNIYFYGRTDEYTKMLLIGGAEALVLPSNERSEAFGLALIEAASLGTPQISTEIGTATSFINQHGITGYVVPPDDSLALRAAMERILKEKSKAADFSRSTESRYQQMFSGTSMAHRYHELYRRVVIP